MIVCFQMHTIGMTCEYSIYVLFEYLCKDVGWRSVGWDHRVNYLSR
jgi:hypothetical protein